MYEPIRDKLFLLLDLFVCTCSLFIFAAVNHETPMIDLR